MASWLNMKYLITESQYNKAIDKFISLQLIPHTRHRTGGSLYWVKDDQIICEYNLRFHDFWFRESIWKDIEDMFALEFYEVADVLKKWLEIHEGVSSEKIKINYLPYFRLPIEAVRYMPDL